MDSEANLESLRVGKIATFCDKSRPNVARPLIASLNRELRAC